MICLDTNAVIPVLNHPTSLVRTRIDAAIGPGRLEAAMARNILTFSDGTGQVGGYAFDEDRTNIYKIFRATRVCPDSCIDPKEPSMTQG
jgi:hypothetical protein